MNGSRFVPYEAKVFLDAGFGDPLERSIEIMLVNCRLGQIESFGVCSDVQFNEYSLDGRKAQRCPTGDPCAAFDPETGLYVISRGVFLLPSIERPEVLVACEKDACEHEAHCSQECSNSSCFVSCRYNSSLGTPCDHGRVDLLCSRCVCDGSQCFFRRGEECHECKVCA